jgi:hypothetical protein
MKRILGWLLMMCLMAACSDPDQGPPLGPFAAITKTTADKPFEIVPPSSRSPAPFTYTSSDLAVATIAGSVVTITGPGVTTITATQARIGSYGPTSASTTLTVTPACIPPATLSNKACVAPATGATMVTANAYAWMGVSKLDTWDHARDFCASSTIEGVSGWHQPTADELAALHKSGAIDGHGWSVGPTWSSTAGAASSANHVAVDLASGVGAERGNATSAYVSCVR